MSWQGPADTARTWPGAHLPPGGHPRDTIFNSFGVPQYPPGTTCKMLGEPDPYFAITWHFFVMCLVAFVLYVLWPIYVLRHLMRNKSVYGDQKAFEANHEKFRKYGQKFVQHDSGEKARSDVS